MPIFKKRNLKLKWRLLIFIIPISLIPLTIIFIIFSINTYKYITQQRQILNDTTVYQLATNMEKTIQDRISKIPPVISLKSIKDNIYKNKFDNIQDEENTAKAIQDGLDSYSNFDGNFYIINSGLRSLKANRNFSLWKSRRIDNEFNYTNLINFESLIIEAKARLISMKLGQSENNIALETSQNIYGESLVLYDNDAIIGKLSSKSMKDADIYLSIIWPITTTTRTYTDSTSFIMYLINNDKFSNIFSSIIKSYGVINDDSIFIFDYKNDLLYSNVDAQMNNIVQEQVVKNYINLKTSNPKNITGEDYHTFIFDTKFNNKNYQTYVFNTGLYSDFMSGIKIVFFYPSEKNLAPFVKIFFLIGFITFICILFIIIISLLVSNSIVKPISILDHATSKVSTGDLNVEIVTESRDEIGDLYRNFNKMLLTVNDVLANIQKSSNNLSGYHNTLDSVITTFDTTLKRQADSISGSVETFGKVNDSVIKIVQNVRDSIRLTSQAEEQASVSNMIINDMSNEIKMISETTKQINQITDLINGISEKTRLLSLNAAIEANRAGDSGKGFNVVASEIRKLATQSNEAANEIAVLIKANEKRVKNGVDKTFDAINSINDINSTVQSINEIVSQIYTAIEEQSVGSQAMMEIINSFSDDANHNLKLIDSLEKTRNNLSLEIENMHELILSFKVQDSNKEIIKDIKYYTHLEKDKLNRLKKESKLEKKRLKREKLKNISKKTLEEENIESIKKLDEYRPKKMFFKNISRNRK
jgi:methyl-accepting chemotaxis protein